MDDRVDQFIGGVIQLRDNLDAEYQRLRDLIHPSEYDIGRGDALLLTCRELDILLVKLKNG